MYWGKEAQDSRCSSDLDAGCLSVSGLEFGRVRWGEGADQEWVEDR